MPILHCLESMFISDRYQIVYLEVPRTGSRSVTVALTAFDPESPTALARSESGTAYQYHDFRVPSELLRDYCVIAAHRNPYSRLWSYWNHRHKSGNPDVLKTISWRRYVDWACVPDSVPELKGANRDLPISEMFDCDKVDFWLCFETFQKSWDELAEHLEVKLPELKQTNSSNSVEGLQQAYDEALAERVYQRFRKDFVRFGYAADSWKRQ